MNAFAPMLHTGVRNIFGVKNGYRGFYSENLINLSPKEVDSIQHKGGTILGTSRGGSDISKIVDSIQARGINHVRTPCCLKAEACSFPAQASSAC